MSNNVNNATVLVESKTINRNIKRVGHLWAVHMLFFPSFREFFVSILHLENMNKHLMQVGALINLIISCI